MIRKARIGCYSNAAILTNVGFALVFPEETAECVCERLKAAFTYIVGAPMRIVFDNATDIGHKVMKGLCGSRMEPRRAACLCLIGRLSLS